MFTFGMPVSAGQLRNIRQTLSDIKRAISNEDDLKDFADELVGTIKAFDERVDERGQVKEPDKGPELGSRARSDDEQDKADDAKADKPAPPSFGSKDDD